MGRYAGAGTNEPQACGAHGLDVVRWSAAQFERPSGCVDASRLADFARLRWLGIIGRSRPVDSFAFVWRGSRQVMGTSRLRHRSPTRTLSRTAGLSHPHAPVMRNTQQLSAPGVSRNNSGPFEAYSPFGLVVHSNNG